MQAVRNSVGSAEALHIEAIGAAPFWQTRYHDFNVFTHDKRVEKIKYMHRNPVVRGLVEKPEDWPHSSYRHYLRNEASRVTITNPF